MAQRSLRTCYYSNVRCPSTKYWPTRPYSPVQKNRTLVIWRDCNSHLLTTTTMIAKYYSQTQTATTLGSKLNVPLFLCASFCALRQETIVEKLQHEILPTSMGTLYSSHTERWGGRCKERVHECFTLCRLGSLGHRSPAWVLFTALPAHEVSLPGLEQGQSSSVSPFLSQVLSRSGQPRVTVGPVKAPNGCPPSH